MSYEEMVAAQSGALHALNTETPKKEPPKKTVKPKAAEVNDLDSPHQDPFDYQSAKPEVVTREPGEEVDLEPEPEPVAAPEGENAPPPGEGEEAPVGEPMPEAAEIQTRLTEMETKLKTTLGELETANKDIAFYKNVVSQLETNPQAFIQQYFPDAFKPPVDPKAILDAEFGANFVTAEYDERESMIPGTKSYLYKDRFEQLRVERLSAQKPQGNPVEEQKKFYDEGAEFYSVVERELSAKGIAREEIDKIFAQISEEAKSKLNPAQTHAMKYAALAVKYAAERKLAVTEEAKRLIAEGRLRQGKREDLPPGPPGRGRSEKPAEEVNDGEFGGLKTAGYGFQ